MAGSPQSVVDKILAAHPASPAARGTAFAPANIALCKYWGKRDTALNLPVTSSLSLSLGELGAETTLAVHPDASSDTVLLNGEPVAPDTSFARRVTAYLDLFRPEPSTGFAVTTTSTIPVAAGLASSASGFAALALALDQLFDWNLSRQELSILARLGSGSAARSVYPGLVEWHAGTDPEGMDSYAVPIEADWPELRLGLAVIDEGTKPIGSREAMQRTIESSTLYRAWPQQVARDLPALKAAMAARDIEALGSVAERNALSMHATMIAASPSVCYWQPATLERLQAVWQARNAGIPVYATMDAGPNVKLLYLADDEARLKDVIPTSHSIAPL